MANTTRVTVGSQTTSVPIVLSTRADPFNVGLGVKLSAGATLTYTVEHTFDDVQDPAFSPATAVWYSNATVVSQTTNKDGNYAFPVTAIRLNVTAWTSGTATLTAIQAGY
jgi:hypothetical protein